jgi:hypothetical protein
MPPLSADIIWDDYISTGVPSSGAKKPNKADIRTWARDKERNFANRAEAIAANLSSVAVGSKIHLRGHTLEAIGAADYIRIAAAPSPVTPFHFQDSSGNWFENCETRVSPQMAGELNNGSDGTTYLQAALDFLRPVFLPYTNSQSTFYSIGQVTIPQTCKGIFGETGRSYGVVLKHRAGATGSMIKSPNLRVQFSSFRDFVMIGNGEAAETCAFDRTGFSYCDFVNLWVRDFKQDGFYGNGSNYAINQISNNIYNNCRVENCGRDGWRYDAVPPVGEANTAETYINCYGSGCVGIGFNELFGQSNNYVGITAQGNAGGDIYLNGKQSNVTGYTEGVAFPVHFGPASEKNTALVRSSYGFAETFLDEGKSNSYSIGGEVNPEQQLFSNPYFTKWALSTPDFIAKDGTSVLASFSDSESPADFGMSFTVTTNFNGLIFSLMKPMSYLAGQWVTLILEIDTSGCPAPIASRIYAADGATLNSAAGEFIALTVPVTAAGKFLKLAYDVKFPVSASGVPTVRWYPVYSGLLASHAIKIRRAAIIQGQSNRISPWLGKEYVDTVTSAQLAVRTNGINIHAKKAGKPVFTSNTLKTFFAQGTADNAAWISSDGATTITPV